MWELDHKENWVPKNWWFWTVVLEKTLESSLDSKEIQPVHPKGNQSWIFIGRTVAEAETPILWPPDVKSWLIRVFSKESVLCIRWPKDWSFSFSISPSNGYSGLISFRVDWLDLLAVQGTHKSLLQHHSSKASNLRCSAVFIVQLLHPYMTTEKNHSFD